MHSARLSRICPGGAAQPAAEDDMFDEVRWIAKPEEYGRRLSLDVVSVALVAASGALIVVCGYRAVL